MTKERVAARTGIEFAIATLSAVTRHQDGTSIVDIQATYFAERANCIFRIPLSSDLRMRKIPERTIQYNERKKLVEPWPTFKERSLVSEIFHDPHSAWKWEDI